MRIFCTRRRVFRLRVVANSDSLADQAVKLRVRDVVLPLAMENPLSLVKIRAAARAIDPTALAARGLFRFGGYASDAVVVTLGAGKGKNWWGILYSSISGVPNEPVKFESWILTILRSWRWI